MPKYDYKCTNCGVVYERREGFDAPQEQTCPSCAGLARRVFVAPPILFKGSGFYITDSKSGSSAMTGTSTPKEAVDGDKTPAAASSESKPAEAAKTEPAAAKSD